MLNKQIAVVPKLDNSGLIKMISEYYQSSLVNFEVPLLNENNDNVFMQIKKEDNAENYWIYSIGSLIKD